MCFMTALTHPRIELRRHVVVPADRYHRLSDLGAYLGTLTPALDCCAVLVLSPRFSFHELGFRGSGRT